MVARVATGADSARNRRRVSEGPRRLHDVSSGGAEVSGRIVTIPNLLSLVRLALIPLFLVYLAHGEYLAALLTIVATSVTDFLDGFLARKLGQVSRVGQLLDPIIDRLTVVAMVLGLLATGILPWIIVVVVVARELALLGLGIVLHRHGMGPPPVSLVGKAGTALLLTAMPVLVAADAFPPVGALLRWLGLALAVAGACVYWISGTGYAIRARRQILAQRDDTPRASVTLNSQRRSDDAR
jgi:cardiolipin synthase (CMP-forming)